MGVRAFRVLRMQGQEMGSKVPEGGRKRFGSVDQRMALATHFALRKSQCIHIENMYAKHCNSNCPTGFLFLSPASSSHRARVIFNLNNHKLGKYRSHSPYYLNAHEFLIEQSFRSYQPTAVVSPLSNSVGGCVPQSSQAGVLTSSTKTPKNEKRKDVREY